MKRGEIYFNREVDFLTAETSQYVKIGIVQEERKSEDRKKEHQTGNPREITIETRIEDTPDALGLESTLHNRFNARRINGEWFLLDSQEIENIKLVGLSLRDEQISNLPYYEKMEIANELLSNGLTRDASQEEKVLAERASQLTGEISILEARKSITRSALLQSIDLHTTEITGILSIDKSKDSVIFNKAKFIAEHPEISQQYQKVKPAKMTANYSATYKMTLPRISKEINEEVKALPKELHDSRITNQGLDRSIELEVLHANYLEYDRKIEILRWELTFIEWKIKSSIYNYEKVVDLATWKRTLSPSSSELDVEAVKKHHPALYDSYMETKPGKWSVHINPFRPYPINTFSLNEVYSECIETV